jgi:hypothetical protein
MMPREEHLADKRRALAYLEGGDLACAVAAMIADLTAHPHHGRRIAQRLGGSKRPSVV